MNKERDRLFGTDGIRGTPGVYPLTDGMVFKIGSGAARLLHYKNRDQHRLPKVVIGKDTRSSGNRIETVLADAFTSRGVDVLLAGIISTAGTSFLVNKLNADMGIMISASHNEPADNGIKFFNPQGYKLSLEEEETIEDIIFRSLINVANGSMVKRKGEVQSVKDAQSRYVEFLISTAGDSDLRGFRLALDCACGSGSVFAKELFRQLGAEVHAINDDPRGEMINVCGSMNPSLLQKVVLQKNADIGIALDGDGDRAILIDEQGNVLDGDYILAIVARHLISKGSLPQNTIVTTVMSNLGLRLSLEEAGGRLISARIGDKYVLDGLIKHGLNIGGEQSGRIIFLDYLPASSGLLTALQVLKVMKETGSRLSELSTCMKKVPQVLVNVKVKEKPPFSSISRLDETVSSCESKLGDDGRVLVRYSGTEPFARIMVEGEVLEEIKGMANLIAGVIREAIGKENKL